MAVSVAIRSNSQLRRRRCASPAPAQPDALRPGFHCGLPLALGALGLLAVSGCATSRKSKIDWNAFMQELATEHAVVEHMEGRNGIGPDAPVSALPPAPAPESIAASKVGEVTIQPDAVVQIGVKEDPGLDGSYTVNEISAVELGYVGPVFLHNMTAQEATAKIKQVLEARFFNQATVNVRILRASYDKIAVHGAVETPGIIKIGSGDKISLNEALLRSGRIMTAIKGVKVRIVRSGMLSAVAASADGEIYALTGEDGAPLVPDVNLWNGDIAYVFSTIQQAKQEVVQEGPKDILVLGEVNRQGVYRFDGSAPCTLMHLIFKMEGFPDFADTRAIRIIRRADSGSEEEIRVDASTILREGSPEDDIPLENGDRIIVPARRFSLFN
jgi:protein involved in polysaccharide export with SLBB domain